MEDMDGQMETLKGPILRSRFGMLTASEVTIKRGNDHPEQLRQSP